MLQFLRISLLTPLVLVAAMCLAGCGTTRSTDTTRTATEQLLISDAIDRAVESMNLQTLAHQTVFLDDTKLSDTVDRNYYISTLRQQLLATGCELRDKKEEADFVVEARAGAIGTDRNELLFGLPSMNVPQIPLVQPVPAAIPEIPIAKRKDQRGVAKIAVFAYHRATGTPVWQSGIVRQESSSNDVWIFGAGPFQHGTIHDATEFAGKSIHNEGGKNGVGPERLPAVSVSRENTFTSPELLAKKTLPAADNKIVAAADNAKVEAQAVGSASTSLVPAAPTVATTSPVPSATQAAVSVPQPKISAGSDAGAAALNALLKPALLNSPQIPSAYARMGDSTPLPQPRFNSPQ